MKTYVIAEAGVNHNGDINLALKLIDAAVGAGVDCIKFQTFKAENLVSSKAQKAEYQKKTTGSSESQLDMIKKLELSYNDFSLIHNYCKQKNIDFASTPFDMESIEYLKTIDMPFWKISSGEITNLPYLVEIAKTKQPIIMSTGMCELWEIDEAMQVLKENGSSDIVLLHCNTEYPTPFEDVNLLAMNVLKERYDVKVGYSDHTVGIEIPIAAVALGATIIEKHFTLDKTMEGPDHKASLEPQELKAMVDAIRNVEICRGSGIKQPSKSEIKNMNIARKSIVASARIKKGEVFTEKNITVKRPGNGISPMKWNSVIGRVASKDFFEDELIEL